MNMLLSSNPGADLSAAELRALCRSGSFDGPTAGYADHHVQTNLMIVPQQYALRRTVPVMAICARMCRAIGFLKTVCSRRKSAISRPIGVTIW